jgi:hypothetical protein
VGTRLLCFVLCFDAMCCGGACNEHEFKYHEIRSVIMKIDKISPVFLVHKKSVGYNLKNSNFEKL